VVPAVRLRLSAASVLVALLLVPAVGAAAPTISGADGDAWNASETPASYVITGTAPGALISWQLEAAGAAVPGVAGAGASPLTVTLAGAPDGALTLAATQSLPLDPGRAARAFTIDTAPPTVAVARPAGGAVYARGERVTADYACAGAATCAGPVAPGAPIDTSTGGPRSFTVIATDAAGNTAQQRIDYRVTAAPAPPVQTLTLPPPGGGPASLPARNPSRLRPSLGISLPFREPVLGWTRVGTARLYNLQIFRVRNGKATKILSEFPTRTLFRVPAGRLAWGERYVWRVWPLVGNRYAPAPHGQSWFEIRKPVQLTPAQLLVNQRISQAALRRVAAISDWLDAGLVAGDLRDGGLGREDFAADVGLTGAGVAIQNGVAAPRPIRVAPAPRATPRLRVTVRQLRINQRISQAAVRRAGALERRISGGLTGGDLRAGAIEADKLAPGLLVETAQPTGPGPPPSRTTVARVARRTAARVELSDRQILINQHISQEAVRRANRLARHIGRGLTGTNFRDGAIAAVSISPSLR
jgi:hypothetical protein